MDALGGASICWSRRGSVVDCIAGLNLVMSWIAAVMLGSAVGQADIPDHVAVGRKVKQLNVTKF